MIKTHLLCDLLQKTRFINKKNNLLAMLKIIPIECIVCSEFVSETRDREDEKNIYQLQSTF